DAHVGAQRAQIDIGIMNAVAAYIDLPLIYDFKAVYAAQGRAFARSALPYDGHHLPLGHGKRHALEHLVCAKAFMYVLEFDHYRHCCSFHAPSVERAPYWSLRSSLRLHTDKG